MPSSLVHMNACKYVAVNKGGIAGKPDDIAALIDRRWRIPPRGWRIWINIRHGAIFPKHGVFRSVSSNGLVADTRNAHDLTIIIDRRGGSGCVASDQRQFVDLIVEVPESTSLDETGRLGARRTFQYLQHHSPPSPPLDASYWLPWQNRCFHPENWEAPSSDSGSVPRRSQD